MSKLADRKVEPYRLDPGFERALVLTCCRDPDLWETHGKYIEVDALSEAGADEARKVRAPGKMALRAVAAIYQRAKRGPSSATEVNQELQRWRQEGRATQEECAATAALLAAAQSDPTRQGTSTIRDQLAREIVPRLLSQTLEAGMHEYSASRGQDSTALERGLEVIRSIKGLNGASSSALSAEVDYLEDIDPERIHWLWRNRIAFGKLTVIEGDPKTGKSLVTLEIAARLTRGESLPGDESHKLDPANIVVVSAEDDVADTIKPRLLAAGADMSRCRTIRIRDRGLNRLPELTSADLAVMEKAVVEHEARMLILDPLAAFLPSKVDANIDHHIRRVLQPLATMAARTGVALEVVRHWNKNAQSGKAIYRGGASIGIAGAARSILVVGKDPDDPRRRVLAST